MSKKEGPFIGIAVWAFAFLPYLVIVYSAFNGESAIMILLFIVGGFPLFLFLPAMLSELKGRDDKNDPPKDGE